METKRSTAPVRPSPGWKNPAAAPTVAVPAGTKPAGRHLPASRPCGSRQVTGHGMAEAAARGHLRTATFERWPGARRRH